MPGEFELIRRFFTRPAPHALLGVGDDAALIDLTPGMSLATSTDMLVSGRHFFSDVNPYLLGRKSLAVNLSDMAAMAARPRWATLALALPTVDETWLEHFSRGFFSLADEYKVELIGGDTTAGPLNICVQIMGEVAPTQALRRDGAKVGDDIWVSGELGAAALALHAMQNKIVLSSDSLARCALRLHDPSPRVVLGLALRGIALCAIDVSDGLLADLGHILERSKVGAEILFSDVRCSADVREFIDQPLGQQALLAGGDDYELCFTAPENRRNDIEQIGEKINLPLSRIGRIVAGDKLIVRDQQGRAMNMEYAGFDHFN